jgi:hypothetical protein
MLPPSHCPHPLALFLQGAAQEATRGTAQPDLDGADPSHEQTASSDLPAFNPAAAVAEAPLSMSPPAAEQTLQPVLLAMLDDMARDKELCELGECFLSGVVDATPAGGSAASAGSSHSDRSRSSPASSFCGKKRGARGGPLGGSTTKRTLALPSPVVPVDAGTLESVTPARVGALAPATVLSQHRGGSNPVTEKAEAFWREQAATLDTLPALLDALQPSRVRVAAVKTQLDAHGAQAKIVVRVLLTTLTRAGKQALGTQQTADVFRHLLGPEWQTSLAEPDKALAQKHILKPDCITLLRTAVTEQQEWVRAALADVCDPS